MDHFRWTSDSVIGDAAYGTAFSPDSGTPNNFAPAAQTYKHEKCNDENVSYTVSDRHTISSSCTEAASGRPSDTRAIIVNRTMADRSDDREMSHSNKGKGSLPRRGLKVFVCECGNRQTEAEKQHDSK